MSKLTGWNIFLGLILSSNLVVADDVKRIAPGQHANADLTRRATSSSSSLASAMEAASATTVGTNQPARSSFTTALPPLPSA